MNNDIQNALVARSTVSSTAQAGNANTTKAQTGSDLPPAEKTDREETAAQPTRVDVEKAAKDLASRASELGRDLRFEVDDDSGITVIKVIDPTTEEVVRQIPSEEAVERASQGDSATLNLINETA